MNALKQLGVEPVGRLLMRMSLPACSGLLIIMLYNVVDTIFIGHYAGVSAMAGLSVVLPVAMFLPTIGMAIGIGSGSIISRNLGMRRLKNAQKAFGNGVSLSVVICVITTAISYYFAHEILYLFGARNNIMPYAMAYYRIVLIGIPVVGIWMFGNNCLRAEGNAKQVMFGQWMSAIINIILDAVLIVWLNKGIAGAAIATVISQVIGLCYVAIYYGCGKTIIKFSWKSCIWELCLVKEILALGMSTLARQGVNSLMVMVLNQSLAKYGGNIAIAVYGILNRINALMFVPALGMTQGFLPIVGYNYGAKLLSRVRSVIVLAIKAGCIIYVCIAIALHLFPGVAIRIFTNNQVVLDIGTIGLKTISITFPLMLIQTLLAGYFQATGFALKAFFLTISRQVLFLIPLLLIFPDFWGIEGIWLCFPVADVLATAVTLLLFRKEWKKLTQATMVPATA
ncbi:Multidrug export protein MepA [invertebrate metagenome]|uniref:Multidrug export protein MepA n=1 Tax=invertebrate metagenome TaxID=1711999 RepID=A0A2H9TAK1_9ZZZZ